jgi:NDP-sugar pyrophosphorylase family protein
MPVASAHEPTRLMFTGIQILEPEIFSYIPRGVFSHSTTDVYPQAIAKGERIAAHVANGRWRELSTLQRYLDISLEMLKESGEALSAGTNCMISEAADVRDAILWDNVVVSAGARVRRAVIADNVHIDSGEFIEGAVVVPRALIEGKAPPAKALKGNIQGSNFVVPLAE